MVGQSGDTPGSSRARDPQADKNNLLRAFLKRDFATEPRPTYPKTNSTDPGRPGFAPTAKKKRERAQTEPAPVQQRATRGARKTTSRPPRRAPSPPPPPRRSRARACRAPHARASPPTERRAAETGAEAGAEAGSGSRRANEKRKQQKDGHGRHPELRDPAPTRSKIRL